MSTYVGYHMPCYAWKMRTLQAATIITYSYKDMQRIACIYVYEKLNSDTYSFQKFLNKI